MVPQVGFFPSRVERFQFRVGHGGFHLTIVNPSGLPDDQLAYIYDVGALPSKSLLRSAIDNCVFELTSRSIGRLNFVVLSHIDEDHVNGLDYLLDALGVAGISTGSLVLPWLSPVEKLLTQSRNMHRSASAVVSRLAADDESADEYLRSLGVESVTRVVPGEDDPDPEEVAESRGEGVRTPSVETSSRPSSGTVFSGQSLRVSGVIQWQLLPLRLDAPAPAIKFFESSIKSQTGLDPSDFANHEPLLRKYRTEIRQAMRNASKQIQGLSPRDITNWSSIALFGGATAVPQATSCVMLPAVGDVYADCSHGWLHTGDLPLSNVSAWTEFHTKLHGSKIILPLCVVVAPHHGSIHSHHDDLYAMTKPETVFLTTGRTVGGATAKGINSATARASAGRSGAVVADLHN